MIEKENHKSPVNLEGFTTSKTRQKISLLQFPFFVIHHSMQSKGHCWDVFIMTVLTDTTGLNHLSEVEQCK